MHSVSTAILAAVLFSIPGARLASASGTEAPAKAGKRGATPILPALGIKTPGIQLPFSLITADATIPAPHSPAWLFFLPDGAGGSGGPRGGRGVGGVRGGRGGAPPTSGGAAPASAGTLFIPFPNKLEKIETKANKAGEPVAGLKKPCGGIVPAFGSLWVPTCGDGALQRLDPKTSKTTATIPAGAADVRGAIAASPDSIWLLTDVKETLSRIDPDQNAVVAELRVPAGCTSLLYAETALWLACPEQNKVLKINAATNIVEKSVEVSARPLSLAAGEGSVWVFCAKDGKVDRIDPKTDKVSKSIELLVPGADGVIAFGEGSVWITMTGFPVTRIDATSETVAQQFRGAGGGGITTGGGALWLSNLSAGTVTRIDPKLLLATLAE